MNSPNQVKKLWLFLYNPILLGLSLLAYLVFFTILFTQENNDFLAHIKFAQIALRNQQYQPHFLYHILLNTLTFFSGRTAFLKIASIVLTTLAVYLKLLLSLMLIDLLSTKNQSTLAPGIKILLVVVLFFISPIINWWQYPRIYLGQFSPNVWHNPTIIMLIPFVLGIMLCVEKEGKYQLENVWKGALLLVLSVFMKPNFALIFLPTIIILSFLPKAIFRNHFIYGIPAALCLGWQFFYTYGTQTDPHQSGLIFSPLKVWLYHCPNPLGSLLVSFAFPVTFAVCFGKKIIHHRLFHWAWLLTIIAMVQFLFLAEQGERMYHANFYWGIVPCLYLLFLASLVDFAMISPARLSNSGKIKYGLCFLILILHFLSGILFYIHSLQGANYHA